jgi:hypothetical protein
MNQNEHQPSPTDAELNNAISDPPPPQSLHCQAELREARVRDYQLAALEKDDPLEANLAALNGGLIEITGQIEALLRLSLDESASNPETLERLRPIFDTYYRGLRQIDRFSHFDQRRVESRQRAAANQRDPLRDKSQWAGLGKGRYGGSIPTFR